MKNPSLLFLLILITLCIPDAKAQAPAGCQSVTTYYDYAHRYIHEQYYVFSSNLSVKQGLYKEYSQKGVVLEEGNYNKGNQFGKWTYRDENNALATVESFDQNGLRDGEYVSYEDDAKDPTKVLPTIDAYYKNGEKNGDYKEYYTYTDDGFHALRENDTYRNDTLVSATVYHYVHGSKLVTTRKDSAGLILVHLQSYYNDGDRQREATLAYTDYDLELDAGDFTGSAGTNIQWYDTTGIVMSKATFSSDRKIEKYELFNRKGKLQQEGKDTLISVGRGFQYVNNGNFINYYESGAKQSQSEGNYLNGAFVGVYKYWNESGSKHENNCTNQNGSTIIDTMWYTDGKIKNVTLFEGFPVNNNGGFGDFNRTACKRYEDYNGQKDSLIIDTLWYNEDQHGTPNPLKIKSITMYIGGNPFYYEGYNYGYGSKGVPDSLLLTILNQPKKYANMLIGKAWYQILNKDFLGAVTTCEQGLKYDSTMKYDSTNLYLEGNLADAYLLSGNYQSAMDIYKKYMGQNNYANLKWEQSIKNDFAAFKSRGIQSGNMDKALKELNLQ